MIRIAFILGLTLAACGGSECKESVSTTSDTTPPVLHGDCACGKTVIVAQGASCAAIEAQCADACR